MATTTTAAPPTAYPRDWDEALNEFLDLRERAAFEERDWTQITTYLIETEFDARSVTAGEAAAELIRDFAPSSVRYGLVAHLPGNEWLRHLFLVSLPDSQLDGWSQIVDDACEASCQSLRAYARARRGRGKHPGVGEPEWTYLLVSRAFHELTAIAIACDPQRTSDELHQTLCTQLRKAEGNMQSVLKAAPWSSFWDLDFEWHVRLLTTTGFGFAVGLARRSFYATQREAVKEFSHRNKNDVLAEHVAIRNAIEQRNVVAAVKSYRNHLENSIRLNWEESAVNAFEKESLELIGWMRSLERRISQ